MQEWRWAITWQFVPIVWWSIRFPVWTPRCAVPEALRVKPKLQWGPEDIGDANKLQELAQGRGHVCQRDQGWRQGYKLPSEHRWPSQVESRGCGVCPAGFQPCFGIFVLFFALFHSCLLNGNVYSIPVYVGGNLLFNFVWAHQYKFTESQKRLSFKFLNNIKAVRRGALGSWTKCILHWAGHEPMGTIGSVVVWMWMFPIGSYMWTLGPAV